MIDEQVIADQLAALLGDAPGDPERESILIRMAVEQLTAMFPYLTHPRTASQRQRASLAVGVIVRAVARVLRNPAATAGFQSESEGGYSYSLQSREASGNIWFPADDLAMLKHSGSDFGVGTARITEARRGLPWRC